jgi:hypothetical protein
MPWMRLERDQEARDRASSHLLVGHRASTDMLTPMAKTWGRQGRRWAMTTNRTYEVRVTGVVPDVALVGLDDVEVARQEMRTVLSGRFTDQAALYGFLHRLRSLGLEVVEVRQVAADAALDDDVPPDTPGPASASEAENGGGSR